MKKLLSALSVGGASVESLTWICPGPASAPASAVFGIIHHRALRLSDLTDKIPPNTRIPPPRSKRRYDDTNPVRKLSDRRSGLCPAEPTAAKLHACRLEELSCPRPLFACGGHPCVQYKSNDNPRYLQPWKYPKRCMATGAGGESFAGEPTDFQTAAAACFRNKLSQAQNGGSFQPTT